MSTKPSAIPTWDSAGTNVTEPTAEKTDGWTAHQTGVSSYMNWFMRLVYQWCAYLRDAVFVGEAGAPGVTATGGTGNQPGVKGTGTGTAPGVHGYGAVGHLTWGVEGEGEFGGILGTGRAGSDGHGVGGQGDGAGGGIVGQGGATGPGVFGTGGASNQPGVYGQGGGSGPGVRGVGGVTNGHGVHGTGDGTGAGVYGQSETGPGGKFLKGSTSGTDGMETDGYLKLTGSDPTVSEDVANKVTPKSLVKVWVVFDLATGSVPTVKNGQHIHATPFTNVAGLYTLTFKTPFADAFYFVGTMPYDHGSIAGGSHNEIRVQSKTSSSITFEVWDETDVSTVTEAHFNGKRLGIMCVGEQ